MPAPWDHFTVEVALESDPDDPAPVWTDITASVATTGAGQPIRIVRGRPDELTAEVPPGECEIWLDNSDHTWTPGNPGSPHYPHWRKGRRIRVSETLGGTTYRRFTGWVVDFDLPDVAEAGVDQVLQVIASDRLARLNESEPWRGTLAAHILASPVADQLLAYWPAAEPTGSTHVEQIAPTAVGPLRITSDHRLGLDGPPSGYVGNIRIGDGHGPPVDALPAVEILGDTDWTSGDPRSRRRLVTPLDISLTGADTITVAAWIAGGSERNFQIWLYNAAAGPVMITLFRSPAAPNWEVFAGDQAGAWEMSMSGAAIPLTTPAGALDLLAMRVTRTSLTLWQAGVTYAADTITGTPPDPLTTDVLLVGDEGVLADLQIYDGDVFGALTEQRALGTVGLAGQTTAERVATLAGYAGVDPGDLDLPTTHTLMQGVSLAGMTPYQAMQQAAATEGGLLFAAGDGRLVLQGRGHRYNRAPDLELPAARISGDLTLRQDEPMVNISQVTINGGGTARSIDRDSVREHGAYTRTETIYAISDAEAASRAQWLTAAYATPHTRCSVLPVDLLPLSEADAADVLAVEIGDHIHIPDLPDGLPDSVEHLAVEGWTEYIGVTTRRIEFNASPFDTTTWFTLDVSELDGTDPIPY